MTCHDCCKKHLTVMNVHASQLHKAVLDHKRTKNEIDIFKIERHIGEIILSLGMIEKGLAERITTEGE